MVSFGLMVNPIEWDDYDRVCLERWWDETDLYTVCGNCGLAVAYAEPCLCSHGRDAEPIGFEFFNQTLGG
jgi:hypothetical protein